MRTIWLNGIAAERPRLGQDFGSLISTLISTGIQAGASIYTAKQAQEAAKKAKDAAQAQAAAAQASAQAAQQSQAAAQAIQQAAAAPLPGAGTSVQTIVPGIPNTTVYIGAGVLGVGAIIVALIATRKSAPTPPVKGAK